MGIKRRFKSWILPSLGMAIGFMVFATQAWAAWSVKGTKIIDPNGNNFIFRGINVPHAWYTDRTAQSFADIAALGGNSVRVVMGNGSQWGNRTSGAEVSKLISLCKTHKLVCVLEIHDATGWDGKTAATHISLAADWWVSPDIRAALTGQENYAIINIANEPFGNGISAETYTNDTVAALRKIREAGLRHMIMVDGSTWGQDYTFHMRDNAAAIFAADPLRNTIFSVHMYEVYSTASAVLHYLTTFQAKGFALLIGEFGTINNGKSVDAAAILKYAQEMGIGYMGWSWSGNGSCCTGLDIVNGFNAKSYTSWGDFLVNSAYGIKATAKLSSNFTEETLIENSDLNAELDGETVRD